MTSDAENGVKEGGNEVLEGISSEAKKIDRRSETSRGNGELGGRPGQVYPSDELVDSLADAILHGKRSPLTLPTAGPVRQEDKRVMSRMAGMPAEAFIEKVSAKLQSIANRTADRIAEKIENDDCKLSDLNMTLAISIDKLQAMSGRVATTGSVNIQINNIGGDSGKISREIIMQQVKNLRGDKQADAVLEVVA